MTNRILIIVVLMLTLSACKTTKKASSEVINKELEAIDIVAKNLPYKGSEERIFDLLHTKLDVSFSWEDQYLFGEAQLFLKPFFYTQNSLELDAKGMDIRQVSLIQADGNLTELNYKYDGKNILIDLAKDYTKEEMVSIYIKYISKPNELEKTEGLSAIADDKGLYFINPLGEDKDKPRQIWTQGEPESNSVWFPTIDHPNERCTQEISITVEDKYIALSNGFIVDNIDNQNGTHTITWKQDKPHAPYLFMMAIGEYAEVRDEWNGMSVNYYVEPEYKNVARSIFGNTPEMLTFFSDILKVPYQWDKYWQVIVRDYVSGAMENTTSVIFGEFVQRNERELLDENHEDIVAHELFHHWFGDLVTCESWANLPLNESFATYGEVLWKEYKYGIDEKYLKVKQDMDGYFREAQSGKQVDMIRFNYDKAEDMFDGHSYAKGGAVLNMLREVVGDDAFFSSLQNYLWTNKYESVEIHDLRIAFEETTGKDLNWFFNQWFLSAGHPVIDVNYEYTDSSVIVKMKQEPSKEDYLIYQLPMAIDIYVGYDVRRENIILDKKYQEFEFKTAVKPELINVDADKVILGVINDNKTLENYVVQYTNAKNLMDKLEALQYFSALEQKPLVVENIFKKAISDEFWYVQETALKLLDTENLNASDYQAIANIAANSKKTSVQSQALYVLGDAKRSEFKQLYESGLNAQSYRVNAASLNAMSSVDVNRALEKAQAWENIDNFEIIDQVGYVYSQKGEKDKAPYYQKLVTTSTDIYKKYYGIYHYSKFLGRMDDETTMNGISFIENWGKTETDGPYTNAVASSALTRIANNYVIKADSYQSELKNSSGLSSSQKMALENEYADILLVLDRIKEASDNLAKTKKK